MAFISVSISLLIILLALHFLAKAKAEFLGPFYRWIAYGVLAVAAGMLLFQLARGCSKVWHRQTCKGAECTSRFHKQKHHKRTMDFHKGMDSCCMTMDDCCAMPGKKVRKVKRDQGMIKESTVDTIDGKIIRKEIEILEDTE